MKNLSFLFISFILILSSKSFCQSYDIYVSDAGNFANPPWQILKFDENGKNPQVFIDESLSWPQDIVFIEDQGIVLISNFSSNIITKYDANTGAYLGVFGRRLSEPTRMKIGKDSLLYVLQWSGSGNVRRYQLDGTSLGDFTSVGVNASIGIDWDSSGNMYISSYYEDYVRKFDKDGNDLGSFIDSNLAGPTNIWFDQNGDLLVSDYDGSSVKRFDSSGNYKGIFISGLSKSEGVGFLPGGNILIGNGGTSSVKLYDTMGNYISDLIQSGSGKLLTPNAVVIRVKDTTNVSSLETGLVKNRKFLLQQNYPNPFNPVTTIYYSLKENGFVQLKIYDITGKEITVLVSEEKPAGNYKIKFDGSNLSSGVYIYTLQVNAFVKYKKMLLLK